ncbi:MAG: alpha-methylacyl-CoA racemase [Pseudonocardiales bacterium]|nr:alpha-methylacyl-CoA racemase [Pseudonocardiales bacterium]
MPGPLQGIRVLEMAGLGPAPFAGMMLADMGADVVRIDRTGTAAGSGAVEGPDGDADPLNRGKRSVAVDLKNPSGVALVLRLLESADVLIEGFRPGVMERLGLGPDVVAARNPRVVYGRMTGWGQDGPLAGGAGHDINYISVAGLLAHVGRAGGSPVPPLNLGDFGAGSMFLVSGVLAALVERSTSGHGQVVDASILDGAAVLMSAFWGMYNAGLFDTAHRGTNMLDSGSYFYDVYRCADGGYVSIAAAEPKFYAEFLARAGLADDPDYAQTLDRAQWPAMKERFAAVFATRTRDEWADLFAGTDGCIAPVLRMDEAVDHPHNTTRATFTRTSGAWQPSPAPRLSRTPSSIAGPPSRRGADTRAVLSEWGLSEADIAALVDGRVVEDSSAHD